VTLPQSTTNELTKCSSKNSHRSRSPSLPGNAELWPVSQPHSRFEEPHPRKDAAPACPTVSENTVPRCSISSTADSAWQLRSRPRLIDPVIGTFHSVEGMRFPAVLTGLILFPKAALMPPCAATNAIEDAPGEDRDLRHLLAGSQSRPRPVRPPPTINASYSRTSSQ
jgi:hypothetical protein